MLDDRPSRPAGIDWDINKAVLDWMGVKKIKLEWMPWESQVPALLSKRTDVIAGNIHHTPERDKVISFSGPAYWYGPVIIVAKGNPLGIKSYDDLKGKKVGSISGVGGRFLSAPDRRQHDAVQDRDRRAAEPQPGPPRGGAGRRPRLSGVRQENQGNNLEPLWDIRGAGRRSSTAAATAWRGLRFRKEDCTLRAAYTQALAEMRANGQVSCILKKYGLSDRNLVLFKLKP